MRRSLALAVVLSLVISGTALAVKPPTAALSLAGPAQYGVPLTFNVSAYTSRETILYSLWVVVRCQAADGGSYLEVGPGQNWVIDGRRSAHTTVGPFTMASGVPPLIPGSSGTTAGDWDGGDGHKRVQVRETTERQQRDNRETTEWASSSSPYPSSSC